MLPKKKASSPSGFGSFLSSVKGALQGKSAPSEPSFNIGAPIIEEIPPVLPPRPTGGQSASRVATGVTNQTINEQDVHFLQKFGKLPPPPPPMPSGTSKESETNMQTPTTSMDQSEDNQHSHSDLKCDTKFNPSSANGKAKLSSMLLGEGGALEKQCLKAGNNDRISMVDAKANLNAMLMKRFGGPPSTCSSPTHSEVVEDLDAKANLSAMLAKRLPTPTSDGDDEATNAKANLSAMLAKRLPTPASDNVDETTTAKANLSAMLAKRLPTPTSDGDDEATNAKANLSAMLAKRLPTPASDGDDEATNAKANLSAMLAKRLPTPASDNVDETTTAKANLSAMLAKRSSPAAVSSQTCSTDPPKLFTTPPPDPPPLPPTPPTTGPGNKGSRPELPKLDGFRVAGPAGSVPANSENQGANETTEKNPPPPPPPIPEPKPKTGPGNQGVYPSVPNHDGIRVAGPAPSGGHLRGITQQQVKPKVVARVVKQKAQVVPPPSTPAVVVPERFRKRRKSFIGQDDDVEVENLRGIFWKPLPPSRIDNTIWATFDDEPPVPFKTHYNIINKLFVKPKNTGRLSPTKKSSNRQLLSNSTESEAICVSEAMNETQTAKGCALEQFSISGKRQQNLGIALARFKTSMQDLKEAIVKLDFAVLTADVVQKLLNLVPDSEEVELAKAVLKQERECTHPGHSSHQFGSESSLTKAELFILEMASISRLRQRLECVFVHLTFKKQANDFTSSTNRYLECCKVIGNNSNLRKLLHIVLCCGNLINEANPQRQGAWGFEVCEGLPKLAQCKATGKSSYSLLHWIAQVVASHAPSILDLPSELNTVEENLSVELSDLKADIRQLEKGLKLLEHEIDCCSKQEDCGPKSAFVRTMQEFVVQEAKPLTKEAKVCWNQLENETENVVVQFGENPKTCTSQKLFSALVTFSKSVVNAHKDNERVSSAENEKMTPKASKCARKVTFNAENKFKGDLLARKIEQGKLRNSMGRPGGGKFDVAKQAEIMKQMKAKLYNKQASAAPPSSPKIPTRRQSVCESKSSS